jgi:hypothetical protein
MSFAKTPRPLTKKRIDDLFHRFSWPLLKACITDHQKAVGLGVSKILWFRLMTGEDNEDTIYRDLQTIFHNDRDSIVAFGSLYFFKMKPVLKESTVKKLQQHFAKRRNPERADTSKS